MKRRTQIWCVQPTSLPVSGKSNKGSHVADSHYGGKIAMKHGAKQGRHGPAEATGMTGMIAMRTSLWPNVLYKASVRGQNTAGLGCFAVPHLQAQWLQDGFGKDSVHGLKMN